MADFEVEIDGSTTPVRVNGTSSFTHTGRTPGQQHTYRVRQLSNDHRANSDWSAPVTGRSRTNTGVLPRWSDDLVDAIAVCTHSNAGTYFDTTRWANAVNYLGIRYLRDDTHEPGENRMRTIATNTGAKFIAISRRPNEGTYVAEQRTMWDRNLSIIAAFEGPNEFDRSDDQMYQTRDFQRALSSWWKASAARNAKPMLGPSPTNAFQEFGTGYPFRKWGDFTGDITYANLHPYTGGLEPENNNATNIRDNIHAWVQEAETYHIKSSDFMGNTVCSTEVGYHTRNQNFAHKGVSEAVEAVYVPRMYAYLFGFLRHRWIADYELIDEDFGPDDSESYFGWVRSNGTYKPVMHSVRNMITLLQDPGTRPTLNRLDYTISGKATSTKDLLLQTRDGRYRLLLWEASRIWDPVTQTNMTGFSRTVTINLPQNATSVKVFQPDRGETTGTQAVSTFNNVSSFQLTSNDNLKIVEIQF